MAALAAQSLVDEKFVQTRTNGYRETAGNAAKDRSGGNKPRRLLLAYGKS
jgi:hypothetical protein